MTAYRYRAARSDGGIVVGELDAVSAGHATVALAERGLFPMAVAALPEPTRSRPVNRRALAIAFRSISALVSVGVPLERAVAATAPLARGAWRAALATTREALREGAGFADALARCHGAVPPVVIGMIRAGERGSQLETALADVATHLEQEAELVARVRQALAYPLLLAVAGTVSVFVIGTVVVPRFADLLRDLGQSLPVATRILLVGSALLGRFWPAVVAVSALLVWGSAECLRRPTSRRRLEQWLLDTPVVGSLRLALTSARVTRALGGMLAAGMPLLPALDAARDAAGDLAVGERLNRARERVAQGSGLAPALERETALVPCALQLVAVGESSGRLADMTRRAGDLAAQDAEQGLRTLVTVLEPALIVTFGGLVAFVAAALLQAVYSLRPA